MAFKIHHPALNLMKVSSLKILLILISLFYFNKKAHSQNFLANTIKYEVTLPFNGPFPAGAVAKIKKSFSNNQHVEIHGGLALQFAGFSSNYIRTLTGTAAKPSDLDISLANTGIYGITELSFFPFSQKHFFINYEIFAGFTNFQTKSEINNIADNLIGDYTESYTFLNYGSTQGIGYRFNKFSLGINLMLSYRGLLDSGRFRPGDLDSFLYPGIQLSWTIN